MTEAAAACKQTAGAPPPALPVAIIAKRGGGSGGAQVFPESLIGDHLFLWDTSGTLVISTPPTGYTAVGTGLASDQNSNCSARLFVKKVTVDAEGTPTAPSGNRLIAFLVRNLRSDWITALAASWYAYTDVMVGNDLTIPGLTLLKPAPVVCLTRRGATVASPFPAYPPVNELYVQNSANAEARLAWTGAFDGTAGDVVSWSGVNVPQTTNSQGRIGLAVALYGA